MIYTTKLFDENDFVLQLQVHNYLSGKMKNNSNKL